MSQTQLQEYEPSVPGHALGRREVRMACAPTRVWVYLDGSDEPIEAELVEVSKRGLQLHLGEEFPVGSLLTIDTGRMAVLGAVRHCDLRPDRSFTVGVQMCDVRPA